MMLSQTTFVGLKEFRQNMSKISLRARKENKRLVILRRNRPFFELHPLKNHRTLDQLFREIQEAEKDVISGRVHSQKEIEKILGIV